MRGYTIWLTGLSSSGKSTIAYLLESTLKIDYGLPNIEVLDGDVIRTTLSKGLGFSKEDREANIKRVGFVCNLLTRNGVPNIASFISPYTETRQELKRNIKYFIEVFVNCPLEDCERRDIKGLYNKARKGGIKMFTGVDAPYEEPKNPDIICNTDKESPEQSVNKIISYLKSTGYPPFERPTI